MSLKVLANMAPLFLSEEKCECVKVTPRGEVRKIFAGRL
jgi:predicted solute-binding protein